MHFRQNRKANENLGRGHSRSWFVGLDVRLYFFIGVYMKSYRLLQDWIQDVSDDTKGKGPADPSGTRHPKAAAAAECAKRDADLRAQYVIVPRGDEAQTVSCPICKESLKSEFLEDDEDWVWKNATKKDDKVLYS